MDENKENTPEKLTLPEKIMKWTLYFVLWACGMTFLIGLLTLAVRFFVWSITSSFGSGLHWQLVP